MAPRRADVRRARVRRRLGRRRKLVTTPLRPTSCCTDSRPMRMPARPPRAASRARTSEPSKSAIVPTGSASVAGSRSPRSHGCRPSPSRPRRPAARNAFVMIAQRPRVTSAIAPVSEPGGRLLVGAFGSSPEAHSWRSTGRPSRPTIVPMSTTSVARPRRRAKHPPAGTKLNWRPASDSAGRDVRVGQGRDRDRIRGDAGAPADPMPNSSRSLPAEMAGTTPAAATLETASTKRVVGGIDIGPPPEKLITFMPSRTPPRTRR